jgi:hypothetical protein
MMRGYEYADADWALRIGTAAATDPTIPRIYHDGLNNRTTIGHNSASQPAVGSAKLNIGDLGTLLLNPQASAPTGAKGMIYCNTNGNFYGHNGTAWVQLNN